MTVGRNPLILIRRAAWPAAGCLVIAYFLGAAIVGENGVLAGAITAAPRPSKPPARPARGGAGAARPPLATARSGPCRSRPCRGDGPPRARPRPPRRGDHPDGRPAPARPARRRRAALASTPSVNRGKSVRRWNGVYAVPHELTLRFCNASAMPAAPWVAPGQMYLPSVDRFASVPQLRYLSQLVEVRDRATLRGVHPRACLGYQWFIQQLLLFAGCWPATGGSPSGDEGGSGSSWRRCCSGSAARGMSSARFGCRLRIFRRRTAPVRCRCASWGCRSSRACRCVGRRRIPAGCLRGCAGTRSPRARA